MLYVEEGLEQEIVKVLSGKFLNFNLTEKLARIGGFGYVDDMDNQKDIFEYIEVPILSNEECEKFYNRKFHDLSDKICLKTNDKESTCR